MIKKLVFLQHHTNVSNAVVADEVSRHQQLSGGSVYLQTGRTYSQICKERSTAGKHKI